MNNKEKFENFLESLKGNGQDTLIESVKQGFQVCYESYPNEEYTITSKDGVELKEGDQAYNYYDGFTGTIGRIAPPIDGKSWFNLTNERNNSSLDGSRVYSFQYALNSGIIDSDGNKRKAKRT